MSNSSTNKLIKYEERMSREQAANILESVARKLKEQGSFTISVGNQTQAIEPPESVKLEIELEERNGKYELEFEIEWREGDTARGPLTIE